MNENEAKIKKDADALAAAGITVEMVQKLQQTVTELEVKVENSDLKNAGLEEMFRTADTTAEPKLREKKSFEPKFHTVRLRKFPIAGDVQNQGYVVGWSDRGAYQEVDTTGVSRQVVDYIDIFFAGREKTEGGKLKAEKVRLLDLINNGTQTVFKILGEEKESKKVQTGEEIDVSIFDPAHGMVATGDKIDGFYTYSDIKYKVEIPGQGEVWIDSKFCNQ